ncbi:MAG: glycosyltransferase family 2 protein [Pasteurella oralis]|uniref:glycosyltransferase family 2 protein n=1 Tax=Pasteurella oralis TaxID=1071947 RepID=UPI00270B85B7|nr:glycosyltransferase family 2 protein [Pasteurella oralis]
MLSIIVPSYNRNAEIKALLSRLTEQTQYHFEVVIVDDCSPDAIKVEQNYPFTVKVIRNKMNQGAAQSRNIGAQLAQGEWLLFLDDDDRFANNKCEMIEKTITENPDINFIYHPAECVMVNERFTYFTHPCKNEKDLTLDNILKANKIGGMPMIAVKKDLFLKVGGLSKDLLSLEDYEFLLKLLSDETFSPKYIDLPLTQCTFHTQRASVSTNNHNTQQAIAFIEEKYIKTAEQKSNFAFNSLYMLAYPHIMNLSRSAAKYYFLMFKQSKNLKYLVVALITATSPKLAINLKRFI